MFNYNHIQAIFINLFIRTIEVNLNKVNDLLARSGYAESVYAMLGVNIVMAMDEQDKNYYLVFNAFGGEHRFKLSKQPRISKRVINELKVWFHKHARDYHADALSFIKGSINEIDIRPTIKSYSIWERLLNQSKEIIVEHRSKLLSDVMTIRIVIHRNLFNKLVVNLDVSSQGPKGRLSSCFPIHFGIFQQYNANVEKDPVNQWIRDIVNEHVENIF